MKYRPIACLLLGVFMLSACRLTDRGENDDTLNTTYITNPNTAYNAGEEKFPVMSFEDGVFDFGTISQGESLKHTFHFTNTGDTDLIITSVKGSCGCTVMKDWPKHPIKPGESGEINIEYLSEGKYGVQNKNVTITSNTSPATTVLRVRGEVVYPTKE